MRTSTITSERAFVGAVINGDAHAADYGLCAADFADEYCHAVFAACLQLEAQGKIPDLVTLCDVMPDADAAALIELTQEASCAASLVSQHADNIRQSSQRRVFAEACLEAVKSAQDASVSLEDTQNKLRAVIDQSGAQGVETGFTSGTDAIIDFAMWLESEEQEDAISTGIPCVDAQLCGGLKAGRFYVIGARTSVGKSALMCAMAAQAIKDGRKVLYISLEMGARENTARMVAAVSGVSLVRINDHKTLTSGDYNALADAYALLPGENFRFSSTARTPSAIRRAALKMRAQTGLDLIVLDYIQIAQPDGKVPSRVEAVGQITGELKALAMELDIPVLSAAQINRAGVQGGSAPRLSDLRESGSIEQDADCVMLMHRPDGQEREMYKRIELCIAKNRQGACGLCELVFDGAHMRFTQLERRYGDR